MLSNKTRQLVKRVSDFFLIPNPVTYNCTEDKTIELDISHAVNSEFFGRTLFLRGIKIRILVGLRYGSNLFFLMICCLSGSKEMLKKCG